MPDKDTFADLEKLLDGFKIEPPADGLVAWSGKLPLWQQDALRRIAQKGALCEEDKEILKTAMLAKQELDIITEELTPLAQEHCKATAEDNKRCILCSIGPVKNVNKLAEDQPPLRFAPTGITLIYGDNGSGKSGYCRIAKKVCRARIEDKILGNAFSDKAYDEPSATIRWQAEGDQAVQEFIWSPKQSSPDSLSTISVFDTKIAARFVEGENKLEYLPFEVDLVSQLVKLCKEFSNYIEHEIETTTKGLIELPDFTPGTTVSNLIERLNNAKKASSMPKEKEFDALAIWRNADEKELKALEKELVADPTHQADIRARCISACEALADTLVNLEQTLSDASADELKAKYEALEKAKAANDADAARKFDDMPLHHVGSDAWHQLFDHARAYAELVYPELDFPYTGNDAKCVLCQQDLDEPARQRFIRFDEFVSDKVAQEYKERKEILANAIKALNEVQIPIPKDARQRLSEFAALDDDRKAKLDILASTLEALAKRKEVLFAAAAVQGSFDGLVKTPSFSDQLKAEIQKLREEEKTYRDVAKDDEARQKKAGHLAELEDRKTLHTNRANVLRFQNDKEKLARLMACHSGVGTGGLSRKVTELRKTHFTDELNKKIKDEIKVLGLSYLNVKVVDQTDKGTSKFSSDIGLKQHTQKSSVLSEGEQRALALACFLAEADISPSKNGLIVDDPVSSLDQERIRCFAERLVQAASEERQVVIFTHNLVFYQEVRSAAAEQKIETATHVVHFSSEDGFGVVKEGDLPQLARKIKDRIPILLADLARIKMIDLTNTEAYQKAVEGFYTELRRTWERLVEEILLGGVVERFNSGVKTLSLKGVIVKDDDYHTIYHAMKQASEYSGHDQATGKKLALPQHDKLEADLTKLIEYRKSISNRRNALSEERKRLEEAPKTNLV